MGRFSLGFGSRLKSAVVNQLADHLRDGRCHSVLPRKEADAGIVHSPGDARDLERIPAEPKPRGLRLGQMDGRKLTGIAEEHHAPAGTGGRRKEVRKGRHAHLVDDHRVDALGPQQGIDRQLGQRDPEETSFAHQLVDQQFELLVKFQQPTVEIFELPGGLSVLLHVEPARANVLQQPAPLFAQAVKLGEQGWVARAQDGFGEEVLAASEFGKVGRAHAQDAALLDKLRALEQIRRSQSRHVDRYVRRRRHQDPFTSREQRPDRLGQRPRLAGPRRAPDEVQGIRGRAADRLPLVRLERCRRHLGRIGDGGRRLEVEKSRENDWGAQFVASVGAEPLQPLAERLQDLPGLRRQIRRGKHLPEVLA